MLVGPGECASFLVAEHVGPASGLVGVLPERQSNRPVVVLPGVVVDPKPVGSCLDNFGREHRHVSRQSIGTETAQQDTGQMETVQQGLLTLASSCADWY